MEYKIVKYSPIYFSKLTRLLAETFSIENKNKKGLIKWKYFDPYFNKKSITYIVVDKNDNLVGHYSSMPISIQYGEKEYKTTLSTDAATDINHRGKGLMSKISAALYKKVAQKGYDFSFGYPNEVGVVMDKHSKNYGYQVIGIFVKYFKFIIFRKNTPYTLVKLNSPEKVTGITSADENFYKIKKNKEYLTWRYLKKPNNEYEVYRIVYDKKDVGYAILHFTQNKCYVLDIIAGKDIIKMKDIVKSIENRALDRKIRLVIYNVFDNEYWKKIFGFPYFKKAKGGVNYYFSVHTHTDTLPANLLNKEHWFLMNGDIL